MTITWTCPDCGLTKLIETDARLREWPEMIEHHQRLAASEHSLRVCMYTLALKAAA